MLTLHSGEDGVIVEEAFQEIMEWQYNHFISTGTMYNFLTGAQSEEVVINPSENDDSETVDESIAKEIEELLEEEEESTKEDNKGIWGHTLQLLKDNWLTIIILIVFASAAVGFILYRKRKAIDDNDAE